MSNVVLIVGDSGTGKSSSLENLDPKSTRIINCLGKRLPWRGSNKNFVKDKNMHSLIKSSDITSAIKAWGANPEVETIVIDDIGFTMLQEFFDKANITGYFMFSINLFNCWKLLRD